MLSRERTKAYPEQPPFYHLRTPPHPFGRAAKNKFAGLVAQLFIDQVKLRGEQTATLEANAVHIGQHPYRLPSTN